MEHLLSLPSPNRWLADCIQHGEYSQNRLARLLGVDEPRFGRWVNEREQIPRIHLAELARQFPTADVQYLLRLKDCEDLADHLHRQTQRLSRSLGLGPYPAQVLFRCIADLAAQEPCRSSLAHANAVLELLVDAARAVHMVQQLALQDFRSSLLDPHSVSRFRFPVNHFVGVLLELDAVVPGHVREARGAAAFREAALGSLRTTVQSHPTRERRTQLARQFTIHLLARHGMPEDRAMLKEQLRPKASDTDPLQRRLSFTGLLLGGKDPDTVERFYHALERDSALASVNLLFNAFHYGQLDLSKTPSLSGSGRSLRCAIPHVLRHLEQADQYTAILSTESLTLIHLIETLGTEPFRRSAIASRLQRLLRDTSALNKHLPRNRRRLLDQSLRAVLSKR